MNSNELKTFIIDNGIDQETAKTIEDQCIDEEAFLQLDEKDLKEMNIKIGIRKKIMTIKHMLCTPIFIDTPKDVNDTDSTPTYSPSASSSLTHISYIESASSLSENETNITIPNQPTAGSSSTQTEFVDIKKFLELEPRGRKILRDLDSNIILTHAQKSELLRIVVGEMVKEVGYYPSAAQKLKYAKSVINNFPQLGIKRCDGSISYKHFYDEKLNSGFIEYRLKTIRRTLSPSKKRYKKRRLTLHSLPTTETLDSSVKDDIDEKISALKYICPTTENKSQIKKMLNDTFQYRKDEIFNGTLTLTEIFEKYPPLLLYNGEMIEHDYNILKGINSVDLFKKFSKYEHKILQYCKNMYPTIIKKIEVELQLAEGETSLQAIIALCLLLPNHNTKKPKKGGLQCLICFLNDTDDIHDKIKELKNNQPYLVLQDNSYSIIAEQKVLSLEANNILNSFDILYKFHQVFNVEYDASLTKFYNFFDCFIYNSEKNVNPTVGSLIVSLMQIADI